MLTFADPAQLGHLDPATAFSIVPSLPSADMSAPVPEHLAQARYPARESNYQTIGRSFSDSEDGWCSHTGPLTVLAALVLLLLHIVDLHHHEG